MKAKIRLYLKYIDASKGYVSDFLDLKNSKNNVEYNPNIKMYRNNLMKLFFKPDNINMQIYEKHIQR